MNELFVTKCQCCGECMHYDEVCECLVCDSCGYREYSSMSSLPPVVSHIDHKGQVKASPSYTT